MEVTVSRVGGGLQGGGVCKGGGGSIGDVRSSTRSFETEYRIQEKTWRRSCGSWMSWLALERGG